LPYANMLPQVFLFVNRQNGQFLKIVAATPRLRNTDLTCT
jgi:hypothetical protein